MDLTRELVERIEWLEAKVRRLEEVCAASDAEPAAPSPGRPSSELRAERLVIVDDEGCERVVIETVAGTGSVLVRVPGPTGATTGIELFASPAADGDRAVVGGCVLRDGDVVEMWSSR